MRKATYRTVNEPPRGAVTRATVRDLASEPSLRGVARIAGKYVEKRPK